MDFSVTDFNVRLRTIKLRELVGAIIVSAVISIMLVYIIPAYEKYDDLFILTVHLLMLVFFIYALRGTSGFEEDIHDIFSPSNREEILYLFVINLFFATIFISIISVFSIVLSVFDPTWVPTMDFSIEEVGPIYYYLDLITGIVGAPLVEELVFRGVLFNRLKIRMGIIGAMLVSSFLFAILHDFGGMISAFVFGLCMCILYLKTDNIFVPMTVHFLNNFTCYVSDFLQLDNTLYNYPVSFLMLTASVISAIALIIYLRKGIKQIKAGCF